MTKKNGANAPTGSACQEKLIACCRHSKQLRKTDVQHYHLCLRKALEEERRAEWQVIELAETSDYFGELLSDEEAARLDLAWKKITRIEQQLAALDGPDWGGQQND